MKPLVRTNAKECALTSFFASSSYAFFFSTSSLSFLATFGHESGIPLIWRTKHELIKTKSKGVRLRSSCLPSCLLACHRSPREEKQADHLVHSAPPAKKTKPITPQRKASRSPHTQGSIEK
jgi:hypothetical protein